jgi:hypothetical protein
VIVEGEMPLAKNQECNWRRELSRCADDLEKEWVDWIQTKFVAK